VARLNNLSDAGVFNSLANITTRSWNNLFLANGTTPITDLLAQTSLGTAALVSGQGALATAALTAAAVTNANVSISAAGVLSGAGGGTVTFASMAPTESSKLGLVEALADVTKSASGPSSIIIEYDSVGVAKAGQVPKVVAGYNLTPTGGAAYTSGVTWAVTILSGSFTGAAPTVSATGVITCSTGLAVAEAILSIAPTYLSKAYPPIVTKIVKVQDAPVAAPPPTTPAFASASANANFSTTTYVAAGPSLLIKTTGTTVSLVASALNLFPNAVSPAGTRVTDGQWQRETTLNSNTWTAIGTATNAQTQPFVFDEGGGTWSPGDGSITVNFTDTGRTASTDYRYRFVLRRTTVTVAGLVSVGGTISAQG
jgi:hypothetical protein